MESFVCHPSLLKETVGSDAGALLRASLCKARTVVVKAGTSVISREDGAPCLSRLGMLVEQISQLVKSGCRVVFVSSGAMGVGRGLLRRQALLQTSIADTMTGNSSRTYNEMTEERTKYNAAAAAAGQLGLSSLYATLFATQQISVAQLLVTAIDFHHEESRQNVRRTILSMLDLDIVPVMNENDAVSANRSFAEGDISFQDNDMLAALVAREIGADVVLFVSDVDGVYTACPTEPGSTRISLFSRNRFPNLSSAGRGRGGMRAKINAALTVLDGSDFTSVDARPPKASLIISGLNHSNITDAMRGVDVGTLFVSKEVEAIVEQQRTVAVARSSFETARLARAGGRKMAAATSAVRSSVLQRLADLLELSAAKIFDANALDLKEAEEKNIAAPLLARLKLTPQKLNSLIEGIKVLVNEEDRVGRVRMERMLSDSLTLKQVEMPIGLLMIIFEARPDCLPQIASLAIRSGNALLLKGGKEALRSNTLLHSLVVQALALESIPAETISLVQSREHVSELLQSKDIDLVIPRGGNALVESIMKQTSIPVLGHTSGICHIFVDESADLKDTLRIVLDAKCSYPSACNAVETILIHENAVETLGRQVNGELMRNEVEVFYGKRAAELNFGLLTADFGKEYGDLRCNFEVVANLDEAIEHINHWGSGHTDCIMTTSPENGAIFQRRVDSACCFVNSSTRFADGKRFGLGAEVGISTGKIHARGPVGVEGLLTTKWLLSSEKSDAVCDYEGAAKNKEYRA